MSGERYLLDTNAVVALLRGDQLLERRLQDADSVAIANRQIANHQFSSIGNRQS